MYYYTVLCVCVCDDSKCMMCEVLCVCIVSDVCVEADWKYYCVNLCMIYHEGLVYGV
jgi:hypothetical protein